MLKQKGTVIVSSSVIILSVCNLSVTDSDHLNTRRLQKTYKILGSHGTEDTQVCF
jgi:hypothetical protein